MANTVTTAFDKRAQWTARECGQAHTFALAVVLVLVWD